MLSNRYKNVDLIEPDDYPARIALQCNVLMPKNDLLKTYSVLTYVDSEARYERFSNILKKLSSIGIPIELRLNLMESISSGESCFFIIEHLASKIEKIPEYMAIFRECMLSNAEITNVLLQAPLLSYNVKNVKHMIDIYTNLGIPKEELKALIIDNPNILNYESPNSARIIKTFISLGMNLEEIKDLVIKTASDEIFTLLDFNIMKNQSIIERLKEYGFENSEIVALVKKDHHVLISNYLVDLVLGHMNSFDMPKSTIKAIILDSPILLYSKSIENSLNVIKAYNLKRYIKALMFENQKLFVEVLIGKVDVDSKYSARINMLRNTTADEDEFD